MQLAPLFLVPLVAYVAFLNACKKSGGGRRWHWDNGRHYGKLDDDETQDDLDIDYCTNYRNLRTIRYEAPSAFPSISVNELHDAILDLWEMDGERADGHYLTDWDLQLTRTNADDRNVPALGKLFPSINFEFCRTGACAALWKVFEAYDNDTAGRVDRATDEFFEQVELSEPYKYVKQYLVDKQHPIGSDFDENVKNIWIGQFKRRHVPGEASGFKHYFIGDEDVRSPGRIDGLHHWLRLAYLESKNRLNFIDYSKFHRSRRILDIHYKITEIRNGNTRDTKILENYIGTSTIVGTGPAFDIAFITLLYYARNYQCSKFFLGDYTGVEVSSRSVRANGGGPRRYFMGSVFAKATDVPCPPEIRDRVRASQMRNQAVMTREHESE